MLSLLKGVLRAQGYHVLRYNSRGVGESTGRASFTGLSEGEDLEAIVQWAVSELGEEVSSVVVCVRSPFVLLVESLLILWVGILAWITYRDAQTTDAKHVLYPPLLPPWTAQLAYFIQVFAL